MKRKDTAVTLAGWRWTWRNREARILAACIPVALVVGVLIGYWLGR